MEEKEKKPAKAEIVETIKEKVGKGKGELVRGEKGRFIEGNMSGGRTKNALNKFTMMKKDLVEVWKKGKGKERFLELLQSRNPADYKWAVERIIAILPKEHLIDMEIGVNPPKVVIVREVKQNDKGDKNE